MVRVLLAGVPRSGTSWTGTALGHAMDVRYVDEPDGFRDAFAFRVMMRHGENPRLDPGEAASDYERLWAGAFAGGYPPRGIPDRLATLAYRKAGTPARRRARSGDRVSPWLRIAQRLARPPVGIGAPDNVVVKSVQCARSVEWIVDRFAPKVVLIARHPLNTIASWRELEFVRNPREHNALANEAATRWGVVAPERDAPLLAHQSFEFAVLTTLLAEAAARHAEWIVVRHEDLCRDAPTELRGLAERIGLVWSDAADEFVRNSDREGSGFMTARVTSEQPERWRDRLQPEDVALIRSVLASFPAGVFADC